MFLRFTSKQTYRIFLLMYILFAIHHSLSCWCLLFEAKAGSCKISISLFSRIFVYRCHRFLQNVIHAKVQSKTNKYCKFHVDLTRRRLSKSRFKKLGMVPKKLYRNTLKANVASGVNLWSEGLKGLWIKCFIHTLNKGATLRKVALMIKEPGGCFLQPNNWFMIVFFELEWRSKI